MNSSQSLDSLCARTLSHAAILSVCTAPCAPLQFDWLDWIDNALSISAKAMPAAIAHLIQEFTADAPSVPLKAPKL